MPNNTRQQLQYVITGNPATVNSVNALIPGQLGRYLQVKQPTSSNPIDAADINGVDKEFRYVKVDSATGGATIGPGVPAFWLDKTKYIVTSDLARAGGANKLAGAFINEATRGNYIFIQTGGPCNLQFPPAPTSNPTDDGNFVHAHVASAGKFDAVATGTASPYLAAGTSMGPLKADNTAIVNLSVPENT